MINNDEPVQDNSSNSNELPLSQNQQQFSKQIRTKSEELAIVFENCLQDPLRYKTQIPAPPNICQKPICQIIHHFGTQQLRKLRKDLQAAKNLPLTNELQAQYLDFTRYQYEHLKRKNTPVTNLDLLGFCITLAFGQLPLTRQRLKQALTISLESILQLLFEFAKSRSAQSTPLISPVSQRTNEQLCLLFDVFQTSQDSHEILTYIDFYRRLKTQHPSAARVFAESILGRRSLVDIAKLHQLTVAGAKRLLQEALNIFREMLPQCECAI
jgi:hypothetical protein